MKRKTFSAFLIALMLLSFCACGANAKNEGYVGYSSDSADMVYDYSNEESSALYSESLYNMPADDRKIIYTANIELETLNYDNSYNLLISSVSQYGGYVASSESYGGESYTSSRTNRRLYITVKIPAENYAAFLSQKDSIGNVTSLSETTDDITTQYVDTQARLEALKAQETRLLELIDKASSVEELLMIENELSNVRYEIESYSSQMKTYDNLISYCTVNISLREANEYSKVSSGFGYKLKEALKSSWISLLNLLQDIVIWLVEILPFCLLFGLIGLLIFKKVKKVKIKNFEKYKTNYNDNNQYNDENSSKELTKKE